MRRLIWALILIPLLIGVAYGLSITVLMSGVIHTVTPGLIASVVTPQWPQWASNSLLGPTNSTRSASFTITNDGQLALKVSYRFQTSQSWAAGNLTVAGGADLNNVNLILAPGSPPTSVTAGFSITNMPAGTSDVTITITLTGTV